MKLTVFFSLIMLAMPTFAAEEGSNLYEITTAGSTVKLKAGERGKVIIAIKAKDGAHVSDEAPLKIELTSRQAKLEKEKLTLVDAQRASKLADPVFEVGFVPSAQGPTSVDAKMTFFICTDKLCARQSKTLSVPVEVN